MAASSGFKPKMLREPSSHAAMRPAKSSMSEPKFQSGQTVEYVPPRNSYSPGGAYVVVALLPERDGLFEYRIKHSKEPYERVAKESELQALAV